MNLVRVKIVYLWTKMLLRVLRNALQACLVAGLLLEVGSQQIRYGRKGSCTINDLLYSLPVLNRISVFG